MSEQNTNRSKWLHVRLSEKEHEKFKAMFATTTCRKMSEYARKILLNKPITTTSRNQSLDDFMAELIRLRTELNNVGNNFNQVVKKLHTLHQIQEFKAWIYTYEKEKNNLLEHVNAIRSFIEKIGDKWLQ